MTEKILRPENLPIQEEKKDATERFEIYEQGSLKEIARNKLRQEHHFRLADEAHESGDKRKEIVLFFENTKELLRRDYDIDNFSNIEAIRLRKIVGEFLEQERAGVKLKEKGEIQSGSMIETEHESIAKWFLDMYGINVRDIPKVFFIIDYTNRKAYDYQSDEKDKAVNKMEDLRKQGYAASIYSKVPDDFKEYLRRLREGAHKP